MLCLIVTICSIFLLNLTFNSELGEHAPHSELVQGHTVRDLELGQFSAGTQAAVPLPQGEQTQGVNIGQGQLLQTGRKLQVRTALD